VIGGRLGRGRCSTFASSHGARIQTSRSSSVVGSPVWPSDRLDDRVRHRHEASAWCWPLSADLCSRCVSLDFTPRRRGPFSSSATSCGPR
jgi:hypothetical protein